MNQQDSRFFDAAFPVKIGDAEYQMSMLTDRDYGDLTQFIQSVYIANAYMAGDLLNDPIKRKELITIALSEATGIGWGSEEGFNILNSIDGHCNFLRVGFQMCRKRHPTLKFVEFEKEARKDLIKSVEQIDMAFKHFSTKNSEDGGGSSTGSNKS